MIQQQNYFSLAFLKKEQIAKDIYSFYFDTTDKNFTFLPGQYIRMVLPNTTDIHDSRFFTISSSPLEKNHIIITLKKTSSKFNQSLFTLSQGESVQIFGPTGGFYFDEQDTSERVFLAGGIGITPFYSMITYVAEKNITTPITLIASFSTIADMAFYESLTNLSKKHPTIKSIYTLTRDLQAGWAGDRGRISEKLIKKYVADIQKPNYYIVGFPGMVSDIEELLEGMGVGLNKIRVEPFTGY